MSTRNTARLGAIVLLALGAGLAGCGKMGALDRPGPLFGSGRATSTDAAEQERQAQDPNRPVNTVDPRQQNVDPAPSRTIPVEGAPQDPLRSAPTGSLPDPYANPRR